MMRVRLRSGPCLWLFFASAAIAADNEDFEPVDLPPELAERFEGIPDEKIDFLRGETNVIGFELVEVNPLVDPGYTSARNAARILRECLKGIAMRERGIIEEHFLSPLTTDHGQD
jgi:agmatinase